MAALAVAHQIDRGGRSLHWLESGAGPAVLLLHGIGSSGAVYGEGIAHLRGRYRVIAPDLAGFGGSDDPPLGFDLNGYALDLSALLDASGVEFAHVLGSSFGALVALQWASMEPERVRSLVLAGPTLGRGREDSTARTRWLSERLAVADDPTKGGWERARAMVSDSSGKEVIDLLAEMQATVHPAGYRMAARLIAAADAEEWLPDLTMPLLVVHGEDDRVTGARVAARVAAARPGTPLVVIPRAGHAPYVESPGPFWEAVTALLDSVEQDVHFPPIERCSGRWQSRDGKRENLEGDCRGPV